MSSESQHHIGLIRDLVSRDGGANIYEATLDTIVAAKSIKSNYNSPTSVDVRFEDLSISTATALSYSYWHYLNNILNNNAMLSAGLGGEQAGSNVQYL